MKPIFVSIILLLAVPAFSEEICFSVPDAQRILNDLYAGQQCLQETLPAADNVISIQGDRILEVQAQRDEAIKNTHETDKRCQEQVKAARGTWWERARKAGGWIGLGIAIGILAGLI